MPNAYGRAFTTANFLPNLAALKAINFGASDPMGCWFVVPNSSTNNVEIWVWEPASTATTNEVDVVRPDSVAPGSPGRCLQRLKFDASSLGGILAAIAALNTAGLIERTADGSASIVGLGSFARTFLGSATDTTARTALNLGSVTNTSDAQKPVSTAQQTALNLKADLASPNFTGTPFVPTAAAGTNTTQAASTAFVMSGLFTKADLVGGFVPSSQLPSFVDDVLEFAALVNFPVTGESGKIYIATSTRLTYRWTGSVYVEISESLALGTTSATAYRGDFGNTAYLHSQATGNPHGTTKTDVGLGNLTNNLQVDLTSNQTIGGAKTFTTVLRVSNGTGNITLQPGSPVSSGFLEIINSANGRLGYIGFDNIDINYMAEGAANHVFNGGIVKITNATQSTSTTTGALVVSGGQAVGGNLNVGGFTSLGDNVAIKKKLLSGTTASTQGSTTLVAHGLNSIKIISISGLIYYSTSGTVPLNSRQANYASVGATDATNFSITNEASNSAGILSRPFYVVIEYIA